MGQCQQKLKENQDANRIAELATLKINEENKIKKLYRAIGGIPETEKGRNIKEIQKVEEEWKEMEEMNKVQSVNQTDQLDTLRLKMKSKNHN